MKTLTLIRHAKSSWKEPDLSDEDRPLSKKGKRDAPAIGELLAQLGMLPDLFLVSPAKRTQATASAIARQLHLDERRRVLEPAIYEADWQDLLKLVCRLGSKVDDLWLCGHNPGLLDLINQLTETHLDNLPSGSVARLRFSISNWEDVSSNKGRLMLLLTPKGLGWRDK